MERTIHTLKDILWACVIDFGGTWYDHFPLIEFIYNNCHHSSIGMAPFEVLYGRRCISPIEWFKVDEKEIFGSDLVHQAMEKVKVISDKVKTTQSCQKSYTNVRQRKLEFNIRDWVFLKVSPMKGVIQFWKKGKLRPWYIGSYLFLRKLVMLHMNWIRPLAWVPFTRCSMCLCFKSMWVILQWLFPWKILVFCIPSIMRRSEDNVGSASPTVVDEGYCFIKRFCGRTKSLKKLLRKSRRTWNPNIFSYSLLYKFMLEKKIIF